MISALQVKAWALCNASYHQTDREKYRALARELYEQDIHERIAALLERSERQNQLLEEALQASREEQAA